MMYRITNAQSHLGIMINLRSKNVFFARKPLISIKENWDAIYLY